MKKVLVTGGPVHAYLDAVKIITNVFKGGLMCQLAEQLAERDMEVTYLCAPKVGAQLPKLRQIEVVEHTGIDDYMEKVVGFAPKMDSVILGAAVANLVPVDPWEGKFPSHNYKPGEEVPPIRFKIADRIIDRVKVVAPKAHLFGYKLLAGVPHEELISAAYSIVLEAKATAVIANDAKNLQQKFVVTKERGVHPMGQGDLAAWIAQMLDDEYYSTVIVGAEGPPEPLVDKVKELIAKYHDKFLHTEAGLIFGTVAVRHKQGFMTTGRGKRELDDIVHVVSVDHIKRVIYASGKKASLNAPLLDWMFKNPLVDHIVHYHEQVEGLPTFPYAPPGTARDTVVRQNFTSCNIKEHGCMLLFDKNGRQL